MRYVIEIDDLDREQVGPDTAWTAILYTVNEETGKTDDQLAAAFGKTPVEALESLGDDAKQYGDEPTNAFLGRSA